jgi:hypothetical protein
MALDTGKDLIDVAAASTALMTLAAWLPPTASLFTIIWLGIRIWETDTVQKLRNKE